MGKFDIMKSQIVDANSPDKLKNILPQNSKEIQEFISSPEYVGLTPSRRADVRNIMKERIDAENAVSGKKAAEEGKNQAKISPEREAELTLQGKRVGAAVSGLVLGGVAGGIYAAATSQAAVTCVATGAACGTGLGLIYAYTLTKEKAKPDPEVPASAPHVVRK